MIPVDSTRFQAIATGIVEPVTEWMETADGKRRPSDVQATSDNGQPLWQIEILRTVSRFGRQATETARVTVPSSTEPTITSLRPVPFQGLEVDFYGTKSGGVRESWSATGIETKGQSQSQG